MLRSSTWLVIFLLLATVAKTSRGDITLPKIFSDHMVLQQNSDVRIWGTADAGEALVVTFNGQTINTTADEEGNWSATIKTPAASTSVSYEVTIASKDGDPKIVLSDVLIGEVWICAGQSNMEWSVKNALNPTTEIDQSKSFSEIRFFTVDRTTSVEPASDFASVKPWDCCSPETVADFSAVAYFFGRELRRELDVPIGLINTSYGGTCAEAWISNSKLNQIESLQPLLKHWQENDNPTSPNKPANLYNGMVAPLRGLQFRGVIWYQGESNVGRGHQYQTLFPALIEDWRAQLGKGREFPFFFAQLAPFRYQQLSNEALPEVWDAQLKTMRTVAGTGMAVITDVGDIKDIHPPNKQTVGQRLSLWALATTYADILDKEKKPEQYSGPICQGATIQDDQLRLSFLHATGGLRSKDGKPLTHFMICGDDQKFHPATVEIDGETLVLTSPEVPEPRFVRFAWDDSAEPNLIGPTGLPASPFRTDNFELLSVGNDF